MGLLKDLEVSKYKRESKGRMAIKFSILFLLIVVVFGFLNIKSVNIYIMKTPLQMEMYYVREYTPTCKFLKIFFKNNF